MREHLDLLALRRDHLELLLEDADELGPLLEHAVDTREASEPLNVGGVRIDHFAIDIGRAWGVSEARLVELADSKLGRRDVGRVLERRHFALKHVDELAVLSLRAVDALEILESRYEVRIDLQGALEVPYGLLGLLHLRVEELAKIVQNLLAIEIVARDVQCASQGCAHLLPVRALLVETCELAHRADVLRVELDYLRVVRLRVLRVAEIVAVPLGQVQTESDLVLRGRLLLQP